MLTYYTEPPGKCPPRSKDTRPAIPLAFCFYFWFVFVADHHIKGFWLPALLTAMANRSIALMHGNTNTLY